MDREDLSGSSGIRGNIRKVVVDNENGHVTIRPDRTASVKRTERWNYARPTYRESVSNGTLTVRASCPSALLNDCAVDLVVLVPRSAVVEAGSVNGDMAVTGFSGRSVSAGVTNGRVTLSDLRSPVVAGRSDNGDVRATPASRPRRAALSSTNGRVHLVVPAGTYDIDAETTNGRVDVSGLKDDPDARRRLSATTTNGDVVLRGS